MSDREAAEEVGLPSPTLAKWKHAPEGSWRYAFYLAITESQATRKVIAKNLNAVREPKQQA